MLLFPSLYRLPFVNYESNMSHDGLEDIHNLLNDAIVSPGDIVECGSSRCGTSLLIARHLRSLNIHKKVYALDSFEGFPRDEFEREKSMGLTDATIRAFTSTNFEYVVAKLRRLGYADCVVPVRGFFEDTLPSVAHRSEYSFVLIDCDLQKSMRYCADTLWPRLVPGGIMAFDDYRSKEFRGARLAIDSFVSSRQSEMKSHGLLNRIFYAKKKSRPKASQTRERTI